MEVGHKVDVRTGTRSDSIDIEAVANEGRGKDSAIDLELGSIASVLSNLLAHTDTVGGAPIAKVERKEDFHAIVGSRLISITELCIGIRISANVQGKCVDAILLGTLHISIIVAWAGTLANNANLYKTLVYMYVIVSTANQP